MPAFRLHYSSSGKICFIRPHRPIDRIDIVDGMNLYAAGRQISDADVLQARARLAGREETVLIAQRTAGDLENQLRELVGKTAYPVDGAPLELEPLPPASPLTANASSDLKRAYDLRPDYQAARLGIVRRRVNSALAQNQLLPRVDFVGSYGYSGMDRDFGAARRQVRDQDARL